MTVGHSGLFALNASSGELKPTGKRDRYVLTLAGLDRRVTWFADCPARHAGQGATGAAWHIGTAGTWPCE